MRRFCAIALGLVGFGTGGANAQETLVVSTWLSPQHEMNATVWPTWAQSVEEATEGRVTVKIEYNLAPPPAQLDLIRDGAADATWIFHGYNPGRFVATQLPELPGTDASAEAISVAYWRVHQNHLAAAEEHRGVKLIGLSTHGPGVLHTRDAISGLDAIDGLKIRIGGGVSGDIGEALGMVGVQVPAPKVYETVSSGVANGVMMPMETKASLKLAEIAPHSMKMPGGFYYGSFAFVMSQERFDSLSPEDQAAIDSVSGEVLSKLAGQAWDAGDDAGEAFAKESGNTIEVADQATLQAFQEKTKAIEATVLERIADLGIDAEAALAELRDLATNYGG
ncbi:MAG: TRAP transporter substrate-binding protein [Geminicoccaceae bacterium]